MNRILIVDDEEAICWGFREFFTDAGFDVCVAASAEDAFETADRSKPDAVLLDVRLPGMDGLAAMKRLRELIGAVPVIVMTAFGNLDTAVRAIQEGAFDYLTKPFDLHQAAAVVQRAINTRQRENTIQQAPTLAAGHEEIIGSSSAMQEVFKRIALVARTAVPVLVTGESGTGKELVARAVHRHSVRAAGPFVPVCLPALNPGLIESELFGHVKGSFTGATEDRRGLFELAHGGTMLLDEIADTSASLQVKLLRAIEQGEITAVGQGEPRPIDTRLIAATNQPLDHLIATGAFREDLFYRLSVFQIHLPPLRDRPDDICNLAEHFLRRSSNGETKVSLSFEAGKELQARSWPGNVRELRNAVEHAAIVARDGQIRPEHFPPPMPMQRDVSLDRELQRRVADWTNKAIDASAPGTTPENLYERLLELVEPPMLHVAISRCNENLTAAAQLLGMHRATLRRKAKDYQLRGDFGHS